MSKLKARVRQWLARYETDPKVMQQLTQVKESCDNIKESCDNIKESCDNTLYHLRKMPETTYAAKKTYETFLREKFIREKAELDARASYSKLLQGLDHESIHTVNTVLARIEALHNADHQELDLFNEDEQRQIRTLRANFWPNIFQLDEGCFAYMDYLLPIKHFEPSVFFYRHEMHYLTAPEHVSEKAIMDIGGFIGDSALVFAKEFKGQIHSFEPTNENYKHMLQTIALNKLAERVTPVNMGIANTARQAPLYVDGSVSSEYPGQFVKEPSEIVEMITLDSYVEQRSIEVGLIKIDTEGAEQDILKGAENTIRAQRPTLIISIYHSAYDFFQIKPMLEAWNLGYKFKIRRPVDGQILAETVLLAETE